MENAPLIAIVYRKKRGDTTSITVHNLLEPSEAYQYWPSCIAWQVECGAFRAIRPTTPCGTFQENRTYLLFLLHNPYPDVTDKETIFSVLPKMPKTKNWIITLAIHE
jgi:hypothetical protein